MNIVIQETIENISILVDETTENISITVSETITPVTISVAEMGIQGQKGDTGSQGLQGETGLTGAQGLQGVQGEQGIKGDTGLQGAQGVQGVAGNDGAAGLNGANGATGATGPQGSKGDTGDVGLQGIQGVKGDTGATGSQGIQGITGDAGAQGLQGETGLQGIQGVAGTNGIDGSQGIQGTQGVKGDTGLQGLKGDTGTAGANGNDGVQGLKGDTGLQGVQGIKGDTGSAGYTPIKNVDYFDGATGLKGDTGDTGAQGIQGIQGIQGVKGDTGVDGGGYEFTNATNLTATGTNQSTALALTSKINNVTTTGAGTGVKLPSATVNDFITIINHGVNALLVYPATGETVEGGAANIPFSLYQGQCYRAGCGSIGVWDGTDLNVYDDEHQTLVLNSVTSEPPAPVTNSGLLYGKYISGKFAAKIKGASGLDTPLQNAFWQNNICMWSPTTATAGVWLGTAGAGAGTYTTALPTTTSIYTTQKRGRWANVITTTNQVLGQRNTEAMFFRGSIAGQGGFFFYARLGFDVWTNGSRFFGGMHSGTTVISAEPSALNNTVGFCIDSGDNGVISFLTRGTAATKASTGYTAITGKGYDIFIFCAPNSSQYTWRIIDTNAGTEASGIATLNLPTNTTMLTAGVLASNAALTTVTAVQLGVNRIYVETDN